MRKIMISLLLTLAVLIFGGSMLSAQTPVVCGGLSDDDCAILTASTQAMADLESTALDFSLDFAIEDIPDIPADITLSMVGTGGYALDSNSVMRAQTQLMSGNLAEGMERLFESFNADIDLIVTIPQELAGQGQPNRFGLTLRMVDGFAYINLDKMAESMGSGAPQGWQGIDLASFYRDFFEQQDFPATSFVPDADTINQMNEFVTIERLDDDSSGDQTLAIFRYSYDYGELFNSEFFSNLMQAQFSTMGLDLDQDALMAAYGEMLSTMELDMTQAIGLDDQLVHEMTFDLNWTPDLQALMEAMDAPSQTEIPSFTVRMNFVANLSQFNDYPTIEAPEDATILPYSMMLP